MSETKSKEARRAARGPKGATSSQNRSFTVAAHSEGVVLVDTTSGRSWTLAEAGGKHVWHPVAFGGNADRAPRGSAKDDAAKDDAA